MYSCLLVLEQPPVLLFAWHISVLLGHVAGCIWVPGCGLILCSHSCHLRLLSPNFIFSLEKVVLTSYSLLFMVYCRLSPASFNQLVLVWEGLYCSTLFSLVPLLSPSLLLWLIALLSHCFCHCYLLQDKVGWRCCGLTFYTCFWHGDSPELCKSMFL